FSGFREQDGLRAGAAADNYSFNLGGGAELPVGLRVRANYQRLQGITWVLRTDQQVPLRTRGRDWPSATVAWSVAAPRGAIARMPRDIRATLRYQETRTTSCLQAAGQAVCVPYVDSRQAQAQLTLDTEFPPSLSAGLQMAYLVNDERQASRKTSQLVITAFVNLSTSVGQIR